MQEGTYAHCLGRGACLAWQLPAGGVEEGVLSCREAADLAPLLVTSTVNSALGLEVGGPSEACWSPADGGKQLFSGGTRHAFPSHMECVILHKLLFPRESKTGISNLISYFSTPEGGV